MLVTTYGHEKTPTGFSGSRLRLVLRLRATTTKTSTGKSRKGKFPTVEKNMSRDVTAATDHPGRSVADPNSGKCQRPESPTTTAQ